MIYFYFFVKNRNNRKREKCTEKRESWDSNPKPYDCTPYACSLNKCVISFIQNKMILENIWKVDKIWGTRPWMLVVLIHSLCITDFLTLILFPRILSMFSLSFEINKVRWRLLLSLWACDALIFISRSFNYLPTRQLIK